MTHETHWELRKDDHLLGRVIAREWDFPWLSCDFEPAPAFDEYRALFTEEYPLLSSDTDTNWDTWEAAFDKIAALNIRFMPVDAAAQQLRAELIDAEDDRPWIRAILG